MINSKKYSGIILSGGKSSRMGQEKGLVKFNGRKLIEYSIKALEPFCDEIIISTNRPELYDEFGFECIRDDKKNIGPIGGIYTMLNKSSYDNNIFLSCDIPFVTADFLKYLIKNYNNETALIPIHGNNKAEPLCAIYNKSILNCVETQINNSDYKLMNLLSNSNAEFLMVDEWVNFTEKLFNNLNSMKDIEGNV